MLISHLDFKGVLPRPSHLRQLLSDTASLGFDAVLVEYEDIFPFEGIDIAYCPEDTWTRETLAGFLADAAELGVEVIPLQQCLGHLEYVYCWEKYRDFALDKLYPSTVDITNDDAKAMILEMLRQMIEGHPGSRYIHVGMDEAHALVKHAEDTGQSMVVLFADFLEEVCIVCEAHGKIPIIWSDMLENYFNAPALKRFEQLKDRVILCSWDYDPVSERMATARIDGPRISREWLAEPRNPQAPAISAGTRWIEDLEAEARAAIEPHTTEGRWFRPVFWCDLWTARGFRLIGASASRRSSDYAVMPPYNGRRTNILSWAEAIKRTGAFGHLVTSWARGTSWCPPNFPFDLTWPLLEEAARATGKEAQPFFAGVDAATVDRLIAMLGRSRENWQMELAVAEEMDALAPAVTAHLYEWEAIALMARVLSWQRDATAAQGEVDYFYPGIRPVPSEWQRRLDDQVRVTREGQALRAAAESHFGERYAGESFREWLREVFDAPIVRLQEHTAICRDKLAQSERRYASQHA